LFNIENTPGFRDALANPLRLDNLLLDRIMTQVGERFVRARLGGTAERQCAIHHIGHRYAVRGAAVAVPLRHCGRAPDSFTGLSAGGGKIADRRVIVVDQTIRSMRDAARMANLFADEVEHSDRTIFVVNRMGEAGQNALSLKDINAVLQVQPSSLIPFLPTLVTPAAHHALVAASKRGKFADAVATLALELSGRQQRRKWWSWRAKR